MPERSNGTRDQGDDFAIDRRPFVGLHITPYNMGQVQNNNSMTIITPTPSQFLHQGKGSMQTRFAQNNKMTPA